MSSNYPPGVTGNESQITGEWPVDPHNPYSVAEVEGGLRGLAYHLVFGERRPSRYGVYFADQEDPASTHPTEREAEAVAEYLNRRVPDFDVLDYKGTPIRLHAWVNTSEAEPPGVVVMITDPDGDADDEGRPIGIPPHVYVRWPGAAADGSEDESFSTTWLAKGWWDEGAPYQCDDVEVVS